MKKILFALILIPLTAQARLFNLKVTNYGSLNCNDGGVDEAFCDYVNGEVLEIEDKINNKLPSGDPSQLLKGTADSSIFAGKGIGTDYASKMDVFLIGAGIGIGADLREDKSTNSDVSGVAVAPGVILGTSLSWMDAKRFMGMDTDRLNLYFNFMNYDYKRDINKKVGQRSDAELDVLALGVHFRYDWIKGKGNKFLGWGGIKFTFGYEYNKNDISFRSEIDKPAGDLGSTPGGETLGGSISGRPEAAISTKTHSIPFALSSDVQLLYFLSLYTGVGVDYNWGLAKGRGRLNSDPDGSQISCNGGACGGGETITVKPEANINATGRPTPFTARAFAGVQFNLPFLRVFVQADKSLGNEVVGATVGARFVY